MNRRAVRVAAGVAVVALLASACDSSGPGDADESPSELFPSENASASPTDPPSPSVSVSETPTEEPSPSESTSASESAAPDDFAVPDEITPEYAQRVINEILRRNATVVLDILRSPVDPSAQELPPEYRSRLEELYAQPILDINARVLLDLVRSQDEREDLLPPDQYEQIRVSGEAILAEEPCVVARVEQDLTGTDADIDRGVSQLAFIVLVPSEGGNETGWKLARLLESDAATGSADEEALRSFVLDDIAEFLPEVCR